MHDNLYDAAVVGGGPAGAVAATALARAGKRVVLLERETFPRFHIGESLLPLSSPVFKRIGVWPKLAGEGFTTKWGATFIMADGSAQYRAEFCAALDKERAGTFHVPRARFDELLLRHAAESGAEVREGCRARGVALDNGAVELELEEGAVAARALIDASGRQGFLSRRLDLRQPDPLLRMVAAYGHFTGVAPLEGEVEGDIRIVSRPDMGWLWFIPLGSGRTSVGAVFDRARHAAGADPAETLQRYLDDTPLAVQVMQDAQRVGEARFEADFSYGVRAYAGSNWLLAGDAGSFLDPVFSTGVHFAVQSGWEAAEALLRGTRGALRAYEKTQRRRYLFFRRFVSGFYDPAWRDLFFSRGRSNSLYRAVVHVLAGEDRPPLRRRLALSLFRLLTLLQRRFAIVPRRHARDRRP